jgi:hypothetical protein
MSGRCVIVPAHEICRVAFRERVVVVAAAECFAVGQFAAS